MYITWKRRSVSYLGQQLSMSHFLTTKLIPAPRPYRSVSQTNSSGAQLGLWNTDGLPLQRKHCGKRLKSLSYKYFHLGYTQRPSVIINWWQGLLMLHCEKSNTLVKNRDLPKWRLILDQHRQKIITNRNDEYATHRRFKERPFVWIIFMFSVSGKYFLTEIHCLF
jgi:hypothetical protein